MSLRIFMQEHINYILQIVDRQRQMELYLFLFIYLFIYLFIFHSLTHLFIRSLTHIHPLIYLLHTRTINSRANQTLYLMTESLQVSCHCFNLVCNSHCFYI